MVGGGRKRKHKLNCQSAGGFRLVPSPWIYVNAAIAYVRKEATLGGPPRDEVRLGG